MSCTIHHMCCGSGSVHAHARAVPQFSAIFIASSEIISPQFLWIVLCIGSVLAVKWRVHNDDSPHCLKIRHCVSSQTPTRFRDLTNGNVTCRHGPTAVNRRREKSAWRLVVNAEARGAFPGPTGVSCEKKPSAAQGTFQK